MRQFIWVCFLFLLSSHELFLKADTYFLDPDTTTELYLFNGTFTESENGITSDRIINPLVLGPNLRYQPQINSFSIDDNVTRFPFTSAETGTYTVGVSTLPRTIELSAEDFKDYLEHEGLNQVIASREQQGISDRSAKERYSKHVKALYQVGVERSGVSDPLGYPIEFLPIDNPYDIPESGVLRFRLLRKGKPLAGQTVHYSYLNEGILAPEQHHTTDKNGEVAIVVDQPGVWYLASIHMEAVQDDEVDYESNWTTLSFEVR
ncbi:DUF4198 domain-containing protein [Robertkochia marina]|uniref:DUF4198 domain-containing protein n=1 Tax=Robertkochia marina TaxID=1227945 RepID=A0A4S3M365_9FLAO|nr:DUF4198 domain-containing protein [Robertkochia marina]THD69129.1 DUF4198 domain-containing protein [Robertkochia marina]TRZ47612.1 DUF4198 domain-containing protein [Robertkochia marina]